MHYVTTGLRGLGLNPVASQIPTPPRVTLEFIQGLVDAAHGMKARMCSIGLGFQPNYQPTTVIGLFERVAFIFKLQQLAGLSPTGYIDQSTAELLYALNDLRSMGGVAAWVTSHFRMRGDEWPVCADGPSYLTHAGNVVVQRARPGRLAQHRPTAQMQERAVQVAIVGVGAVLTWLTTNNENSDYARLRVPRVSAPGKPRNPRVNRADDLGSWNANVWQLFDAALYNGQSAIVNVWYTQPGSQQTPRSVELAVRVGLRRGAYGHDVSHKVDPLMLRWLLAHSQLEEGGAWIRATFMLPHRLTGEMAARDPGFAAYWAGRDGENRETAWANLSIRTHKQYGPRSSLYTVDAAEKETLRALATKEDELRRLRAANASAEQIRKAEAAAKEAGRATAERARRAEVAAQAEKDKYAAMFAFDPAKVAEEQAKLDAVKKAGRGSMPGRGGDSRVVGTRGVVEVGGGGFNTGFGKETPEEKAARRQRAADKAAADKAAADKAAADKAAADKAAADALALAHSEAYVPPQPAVPDIVIAPDGSSLPAIVDPIAPDGSSPPAIVDPIAPLPPQKSGGGGLLLVGVAAVVAYLAFSG